MDSPVTTAGTAVSIRPAQSSDLPALLALERRCFDGDRLTRRSFQHMLTRAHACLLVAGVDGQVAGYALLLFHTGTSLARLYSLAVDPALQGRRIGGALLRHAEAAALKQDCLYLRLEVRSDNVGAIAFYEGAGYREFGIHADYYEDHMQALRLEKRLVTPAAQPPTAALTVPYYPQTLDFTCGPSALMMALKALRPETVLNRRLELRIWREATTVFMTSGLGGCSPFGLALAAYRRGLSVEVHVKDDSIPFLDGVRDAEKKEVIRLVHRDMLEDITATDIRIRYQSLAVPDMEQAIRAGRVPVVLISSYRLYHEKFPHWVVVAGADGRFLYVHDPLVSGLRGLPVDRVAMPIPRDGFARMLRYGKAQLQAALIVGRTDRNV